MEAYVPTVITLLLEDVPLIFDEPPEDEDEELDEDVPLILDDLSEDVDEEYDEEEVDPSLEPSLDPDDEPPVLELSDEEESEPLPVPDEDFPDLEPPCGGLLEVGVV